MKVNMTKGTHQSTVIDTINYFNWMFFVKRNEEMKIFKIDGIGIEIQSQKRAV